MHRFLQCQHRDDTIWLLLRIPVGPESSRAAENSMPNKNDSVNHSDSRLLDRLAQEMERAEAKRDDREERFPDRQWLVPAIEHRTKEIAASVSKTIEKSSEQAWEVVQLLLKWMQQGTIVRVLGAGRARLAASIPANRLAHGGARVYVQDDIIPMPHAVKGGGVIAASASGKTQTLLDMLAVVKRDAPRIKVVGIAKHDAKQFAGYCDHFIGIHQERSSSNTLSALADIGEYVISEALDSLVVAAGKLGGFDDRRWRLGHENIGATGPYDANKERVELLFTEEV